MGPSGRHHPSHTMSRPLCRPLSSRPLTSPHPPSPPLLYCIPSIPRVDCGVKLLRAHIEHLRPRNSQAQHFGGASPAQPQRRRDTAARERLDDPAHARAPRRNLSRHWRHGHAEAGGACSTCKNWCRTGSCGGHDVALGQSGGVRFLRVAEIEISSLLWCHFVRKRLVNGLAFD